MVFVILISTGVNVRVGLDGNAFFEYALVCLRRDEAVAGVIAGQVVPLQTLQPLEVVTLLIGRLRWWGKDFSVRSLRGSVACFGLDSLWDVRTVERVSRAVIGRGADRRTV